jgi:hypothetical protein
MVNFNKITFGPYPTAVNNSFSGKPSFRARIDAAKKIGSRVIPEGDLAEYESRILKTNAENNELDFSAISAVSAELIKSQNTPQSFKTWKQHLFPKICPNCSVLSS